MNNRLDSIESTAADSGERLTKIEDMLTHMQHVLEDALANQDADEPDVNHEHQKHAALAGGSMSDKYWLKNRLQLGRTVTLTRLGSCAVRT